MFAIERLPAWTTNRLKRLTLSPKRYMVDSGLAGALLRVDMRAVLRHGDLLGRLLDTFVLAQLRGELAVCESRPRLHHRRAEGGRHEIDIVAELGAHAVVAVEVKATAAPGADDARHLSWLRDRLGDRFVHGVVLHTGPHVFSLGDRITAAPVCTLWA